jgi:hypothetical protein
LSILLAVERRASRFQDAIAVGEAVIVLRNTIARVVSRAVVHVTNINTFAAILLALFDIVLITVKPTAFMFNLPNIRVADMVKVSFVITKSTNRCSLICKVSFLFEPFKAVRKAGLTHISDVAKGNRRSREEEEGETVDAHDAV